MGKYRYRTVCPRLWDDDKVRDLPDQAKLLWLYLLTGPHTTNLPGLYRCGAGSMAEDLGWDTETVTKRFAELSRNGLARVDWRARVVWVPGATKYNPPANLNIAKGWRSQWELVPDCDLKDEAGAAISEFLGTVSEQYRDGFGTVTKPFRTQEQEQLQKQHQSQDRNNTSSSPTEPDQFALVPDEVIPKTDRTADDIAAVWSSYRDHHPKAPKVLRGDDKRRGLIRDRLKSYSVDDLLGAIAGYHKSPWHQGANDTGTKYLGLDLIMRTDGHVQKGLEMAESPTLGRTSALEMRNAMVMKNMLEEQGDIDE